METRSAFARLRRNGLLGPDEWPRAMVRLRALAEDWIEIAQLAAALVWCRQRPAGRAFLSSDQRLLSAAAAAGFAVIALN